MGNKVELFLEIQNPPSRAGMRAQLRAHACAQARGRNLTYINSSECLKMEKLKIYNYPLLPEALKRKIKLFRPPGNANDN